MVDIVGAHYQFMKKLLIILAIGMIIGAVIYFTWYRAKSKRNKQVQRSEIAPARNAHEHVTRLEDRP